VVDNENDESPENRPTTNDTVHPEPPIPTLPSGQVIDAKNTLHSFDVNPSFVASPVPLSPVTGRRDAAAAIGPAPFAIAQPVATAVAVPLIGPERGAPRTRTTRIVSEPPGRRAEEL
jgi:hypothetical protein